MKRALLALLLLAVAATAVLAYQTAAREREYRRRIAAGEAALAADQTFLAIEAFSGAVALKEDSMLGYLKRGETYERQGQLGAAQRDLLEAQRLDPAAPRPLEQLGDVYYAQRNYEQAAEQYATYVRLDDHSARVFYKLALARYRSGNASRAVTRLNQAVRLNDRMPEAYHLLGLCLRETGYAAEALTALQRAVELAPALVGAREALADLYRELGRPREEIEQLEALGALDPRPERQVVIGVAYARAGQRNAAILKLGAAVERYPEYPGLYVALGRIWLESARGGRDRIALGKALEALEAASASAGESSGEGRMVFGQALQLAGDLALAERVLQQAVARLPVDPRAYLHLADAAEGLGHYAEARQALLNHRALTGEEPDTARRIRYASRVGALSLRVGEPKAAAAWFHWAADLAPPSAQLLSRLAEAQWRAGDREAARATVEAGLQKEPRNAALLALRRRVR